MYKKSAIISNMFEQKDMTIEEIAAFVDAHEWRFAKSMPKMPHWYVVRDQCRSDDEFCRFVMHIRKHGYEKSFWRKKYIYFDYESHSYWTMGAPLTETTILNRAQI